MSTALLLYTTANARVATLLSELDASIERVAAFNRVLRRRGRYGVLFEVDEADDGGAS